MIKKFRDSLKYLKLKDFLSIFVFIIIVIPSIIFKLYNKLIKRNIWIVCEKQNNARDNGYHFFKYVRKSYPDKNVYYIINKKSNDYNKVKEYGNIIQYGSLKHWLFYIASDKKIITHKDANPAPPLFYVLHVYLNLFNNRIYLKHGIVKDDDPVWYYKNTKYKLFICGAKKEYDFVKRCFGYPLQNVRYTGLARFDNLYDNDINKKQVLIIPTWRSWFRDTNFLSSKEEFKNTDYYKNWTNLLNNKKFLNYIESNDIIVYFYPHVNMFKYVDNFAIKSKNIKIVRNNQIDIQTLLKQSSIMITDYSSVYMDFAYMKKPIIYYQFDYDKYRKYQYNEGYFSYKEDGFGPICDKDTIVVDNMIKYIDNNCKIEKKYEKKMEEFYPLHDRNNCKRIYDSINEV